MPWSALPEHLRDVENNFPDDSQYGTKTLFGKVYRWYNKTTKTWFAFSYRCTEWWARWRKYPRVLFAICDARSTFRYENEHGDGLENEHRRLLLNKDVDIWRPIDINGAPVWDIQRAYLSRIQYYSRWHFAIQWPLMVSFHFYPKAEDVPEYKLKSSKGLKGKVWFAYWNHFDADLVYWMVTSAYAGRNWK